MDYKFYLIYEKRLFCQSKEHTYEYVDGKWIDGDWRIVKDRLIGYDPSEGKIGDSDVMSEIREISQEEVIEKYGQKVIDQLFEIQ